MSLADLARREAGAALVEALDALSAALPRAVELARQEEREAERAAVLRWLRRWDPNVYPSWVAEADAIERGEHRREEDK